MVPYIPEKYNDKIKKAEWPEQPSQIERKCETKIHFYLPNKGVEFVENKLKEKFITLVHFRTSENFLKDESGDGWTWVPTYAELALICHQLYIAEECNNSMKKNR